jgi:DnaJ-class molecular chaperone
MNFKYFNADDSKEELKKHYKKLAIKHHPDKGGDTEIMAEVNAEYDKVLKYKDNPHSFEGNPFGGFSGRGSGNFDFDNFGGRADNDLKDLFDMMNDMMGDMGMGGRSRGFDPFGNDNPFGSYGNEDSDKSIYGAEIDFKSTMDLNSFKKKMSDFKKQVIGRAFNPFSGKDSSDVHFKVFVKQKKYHMFRKSDYSIKVEGSKKNLKYFQYLLNTL